MKASIVCGSPDFWLPEKLDDFVIGVDRGALRLIQNGIYPSVAIGDFDSISADEFEQVQAYTKQLIQLPVEKDITDCEAAVEFAITQGYDEINLYGVTGGRIDHFYAVTVLILKYIKRGISITVENEKNKLFVLVPGSNGGIKVKGRKYISFFALGRSVRSLTITGVKYPLNCYDLEVDDSLCVSNEAIGKRISVNFGTGCLLVIQSSD